MNSAWYFCPILNKFGFSWQIFVKLPNIKFHKNPSSGSRTDACGQMDMTKVVGAFADSVNVLET
jgi:hypothetical protein